MSPLQETHARKPSWPEKLHVKSCACTSEQTLAQTECLYDHIKAESVTCQMRVHRLPARQSWCTLNVKQEQTAVQSRRVATA